MALAIKLRVLAVAIAVGAMLVSAGVAAADVPLPQDDPFYAVPSGIGGLANGAILKSRSVQVSQAGGVPLQVHAWELEFKSLDAHGRATAMVTTVMVPDAPWTGGGSRPLVSFQVAEDAAGAQCAASYALHGGLAAGLTESNAYGETGLIASALGRGWAVVAPDYEGPDSHFLAAPEEAHGVLDSIRASLAFTPAGFASGTRLAMMGYSGGGYATSVAAVAQPTYAPELHLSGAAIGSPAASVKAEVTAFNGTVAGGAIAMSIAALERAYPEQHFEQYLNAAGQQAVAATAHDCLAQAAQHEPFGRIENWEAPPNSFNQPAVTSFLNSISPEFIPGHPTIPVFLYHDRTDEFAPIGPALDMVGRWCAAGTPVQIHVEPLGEHIAYEQLGAPLAMSWIDDRFAGRPLATGCHAPMVIKRPPAALRALSLAAGALRIDRRGQITLRLRNPNAVTVTVSGITVRSSFSARLLVRRSVRVRIGAGRSHTFRFGLARAVLRGFQGSRQILVTVNAQGPHGQTIAGRSQRSLIGR